MTSTILFGAGASKGSQDNSPPLGKDLFTVMEKQGGVASKLSMVLKDQFRGNFEAGMASLYEEDRLLAQKFQRQLAFTLLSYQLSQESLYCKLLMEVNLKRVVFCTLNYDILLEEAGVSLDKDVGYFSIYGGDVRVIKPHGSANFWPDDSINHSTNCTFLNLGSGSDYEGKIVPLDRVSSIDKALGNSGMCPSMAFYAPGKEVKWGRNFVDTHLLDWNRQAANSTAIYIVGVRVNADDDHIWDVIGSSKADVYYYGGLDDKVELDLWKKLVGKENIYFKEGWFDFAVKDIVRMINQ